MANLRVLALASALALAFLSGCTLPDSTPTTSRAATGGGAIVDPTTYSIVITNFDGHSSPEKTQGDEFTLPEVTNGTDYHFTERIDGSVVMASTHIGGHLALNSSADPTVKSYPIGGCIHVNGNLPGTITITCHAPAKKGIYHIRGHARITQNGADVDWWSPDLMFKVV